MSSNSTAKDQKITILKNGPYLVSGGVPLFTATITCDATGIPSKWTLGENLKTTENYLLCRCGLSSKKPFCDSTHVKVNFDGTETSDNEPFEKMAKVIDGPELTLKDAEILCASARFCHRGGDIWDTIPESDNPKVKKNAVENSFDCPSGRLVVVDKKTAMKLEPVLSKVIGVIEDPSKGVSGPYWVRGGIPVYSADGKLYEVRNRMTLCRCGKSTNRPFCDSSHYPEESDKEPSRGEKNE